MKLIAKKPCSFGGKQFFIGNEISAELVADPTTQERFGIIAVVSTDDDKKVPVGKPGISYTQEEVDGIVAEAVSAAVAELEKKQEELQQAVAELTQINPDVYDEAFMISVKGASDGENVQMTSIPATPEDIQKVFEIMQMNADEGAKAITDIKSENVLILLHASDSRKTIKDAAKKQADNLFPDDAVPSTIRDSNAATNDTATAGTNSEGADA
ncbi:MAG: hypothetical protein K2P35_10760 [Lachnospiraceae bacterium]|nr:hypothetical protein [Lachnospiraceae bacterium]